MQESDGLAFSASSRLLVDEADSRRTATIERGGEVIDNKTDVVDPRTALGDEFANR